MKYLNLKTGLNYIRVSDKDAQLNGMEYNVVSLFSGAGGLDIGLEQAGFRTAVCVENDLNCRTTLRHNRPEWLLFDHPTKVLNEKIITRAPGDIRHIDAEELLEFAGLKPGKVALVVGGAPCQPFSNIGKKEGENDAKNGDLFLEFVRMVKGIQPEAFIFENVAGIIQSKHSKVLQYMFEQFQGSGYGLSYALLNAANYGVPQRRERFILIGMKGIKEPAFPLPTHMKDQAAWQNFVKELDQVPNFIPQKWVSVKDAFSRLPKDYKSRNDYVVMNISDVVKHRMTFISQGKNFKVLPMELRPNCWKSGKHQGNDTFGRLVADLPSVTIRTAAYNPAKGMYIHPFEDRGLDIIEMAILQDFPLEWEYKTSGREKVTLVSGGKQIGNAVPPGLARALGLAIRKQISAKLESTKKLALPV
ncbi:DNA cytosine methyltransferase [Haliscomenobacter hydrossis]|uniref:DNA (cytosine-5-)-methyltransferase n=1 Tax=Haliscomenobacter hydrossis (strain ATCC 27775 / DSM 1100 / LMG 10767 / O) TaxID=760192 RepID=F4KRY4_HALH1|nr:DNA cytosine methyltransferase [Haliscomenobacter hydrossis]AEE51071.1 DNA-cytosine methyltransferase [Haliscomenobacter hydrossis DSM 1100]